MPFIVTRETKLQSFQYRLVPRIIPCNKWLYDITITDSSKCNFCDEEDNIQHFLLYCKNTHSFWNSFVNWWHYHSEIVIEETLDEHLLFGYPGNTDVELVLNYCILFAKYYIYCKKLNGTNNIDLYDYLVRLKQRLTFEQIICQKYNHDFTKWRYIYDKL